MVKKVKAGKKRTQSANKRKGEREKHGMRGHRWRQRRTRRDIRTNDRGEMDERGTEQRGRQEDGEETSSKQKRREERKDKRMNVGGIEKDESGLRRRQKRSKNENWRRELKQATKRGR